MKPAALLIVVMAAQADGSIGALMTAARPLSEEEIARVLTASRRAVTDVTFRTTQLSSSQQVAGPGQSVAEVLIGRDGRVAVVRTTETLVGGLVAGTGVAGGGAAVHATVETRTVVLDFTGAGAAFCSGGDKSGLVTRYQRVLPDGAWTAEARRHSLGARGLPPLEGAWAMLHDRAGVQSIGTELVDGRPARVFTAPWEPPPDHGRDAPRVGNPAPDVAGEVRRPHHIQALLIDARSLKPIRWEVREGTDAVFGLEFAYARLDLRLPKAPAPACVP